MNQAELDVSLPLSSISTALEKRGWAVCDGFLSDALVEALNQDLGQLEAKNLMSPAGVGRADSFQLNHAIRRDDTFWLDGGTLAQCQLLEKLEQLRLVINQNLFMGLFEFEGHYAIYPPNGFYQKHLDSFRGQSNRLLSVVLYLNQEWLPGDGGELVLYQGDEPTPVEFITPEAGRAVIFLSEDIPHEVLVTKVKRHSIAGWFRVNNSTEKAVDPIC